MKKRPAPFLHSISSATLLAVILAMSSPLQGAGTFTWSGATSGSWSTATNWNAPLTSDNQTDLIFNTTTRTLATSGNGSFIGNPLTVRSISYGSGINAAIATSFNFFNAVTPANLTLSANTGNATITVDAGATGAISLGQAAGVGSNPGALVLASNLDVIHDGSGQLTFNRAVTGNGTGITKTGTGTLAFTGGTVANTYSGLTTVSGGGLTLSKTAGTDAIAGNVLVNGTGTLTLSAADQINNASSVEVAAGIFALGANSETVNGVKLNGGAITSSAGILTSTTAYDLQSGSASAILAGTAGATKSGEGTVTLSGTNTFTGTLNINGGTILASAASATGQDINSATNINLGGGTLQIRTNSTGKTYSTAPITVTSDSSLNWENTSTTNYQLNIDGSASFALTGNLTARNISTTALNANQFNITRAITGAGNLTVETYNNIASSADNYTSGRIQLGGNNSGWNGDLVIARGTAQLTGAANTSGNGSIIIGVTGDAFGAGLTFNPFGLTGSVTYNNDLVVLSGGFRSIKGSGLTGDVNIFLSGNMNLEGNLNVDHSLANNTRYMELSGDISGVGGLSITRAGANGDSVRLSGTNTYTGDTTVTSGKLVVAGSIGASAVTVSGTGTVLATDAAASFGSTIAIQNGAILAPGDAITAGTATVTGTSTFHNGSIFSWDVDSVGTGYDKLVSSNLLGEATAGDAVFRIVASDALVTQNFWNATKTWSDIFTTDGTSAIAGWATHFGNTVTVVNSSFTPLTTTGYGSFSVSGNTLTWTAVPEPTSALAGLLLTAGLLRRRRQGNGRSVVS